MATVEAPVDLDIFLDHNYSASEAIVRQHGELWTKRVAPLFETYAVTRVIAVQRRRSLRGKSGFLGDHQSGDLVAGAKVERSRSPRVKTSLPQGPMEATVDEAAEARKCPQIAEELFQPPAPLSAN